jgi:choline dehydrogenase-like flavoprotein
VTFRDARTLEDGAALEADLCIVGAGAAGITIAREFVDHPVRVVLIESGGRTFAHRPQFLYRGENVGTANYPTTHSRFRMFGGSTTRWGGQCRPLDPIDFEARPWIAHSGWPFPYAHLEPWYRRACEVCNLGPWSWQPEVFAGGPPPLPVSGPKLETRIFRFSHPRDFGRAYGHAIPNRAPCHRNMLDRTIAAVAEVGGALARQHGGERPAEGFPYSGAATPPLCSPMFPRASPTAAPTANLTAINGALRIDRRPRGNLRSASIPSPSFPQD